MIKISCYFTQIEKLPKSFCSLAEKCYKSGFRTLVLARDNDLSLVLDNLLWSYSKKNFIPHATEHDPMPESQPLYISTVFANLNKSDTIILADFGFYRINELLNNPSFNISDFLRIFLIIDVNKRSEIEDIKKSFETNTKHFSFNGFEQTPAGEWKTIV